MNLLMVGNVIKYQGVDWEVDHFNARKHTTLAVLKNGHMCIEVPVEELEFNK